MWTKDVYQEQMLGYLVEVEMEIERHSHSYLRQQDLNQLYTDLDITFQRLWQLIGASDVDWEEFRYPLETSCDQLQHAFYHMPRADASMLSASVTITEDYKGVLIYGKEWQCRDNEPQRCRQSRPVETPEIPHGRTSPNSVRLRPFFC